LQAFIAGPPIPFQLPVHRQLTPLAAGPGASHLPVADVASSHTQHEGGAQLLLSVQLAKERTQTAAPPTACRHSKPGVHAGMQTGAGGGMLRSSEDPGPASRVGGSASTPASGLESAPPDGASEAPVDVWEWCVASALASRRCPISDGSASLDGASTMEPSTGSVASAKPQTAAHDDRSNRSPPCSPAASRGPIRSSCRVGPKRPRGPAAP
jgi:hypothetical protein